MVKNILFNNIYVTHIVFILNQKKFYKIRFYNFKVKKIKMKKKQEDRKEDERNKLFKLLLIH